MLEDDEETVYDLLELASSAKTKSQALRYAKKALALDADNLDVQAMVAELSASSKDILLEKYRKLIDEATAKLTKQGYFDEQNIGEFWLLAETRPYMRLRDSYARLLTDCMKIRAAIKECEEMLRLCQNDNLGKRYNLMHLYVYIEDEESALTLFKEYDSCQCTQFLLPLSMLYYKLGNMKEAAKYLRQLKNVNKDTYTFFDSIVNGTISEGLEDIGYRPFTIEEFIVEIGENRFLMSSMYAYYHCALKKLKSMKK